MHKVYKFIRFFTIHTLLLFLQSYGDDGSGGFAVAGSFPKGFGYGPDDAETEQPAASPEDQPRILLMGLRRSVTDSLH